jgi:hypothetical protein
MAYFSKEAYEGKERWAEHRAYLNSLIPTLTAEQHDALEEICITRHRLHTTIERAFNPESNEFNEFNFYPAEWDADNCCRLFELIEQTGLPKIIIEERTFDNCPDETTIYKELYDTDKYGKLDDLDDDARDALRDDLIQILSSTLERLDRAVRNYLSYIDFLFETDYAPEGSSYGHYETVRTKEIEEIREKIKPVIEANKEKIKEIKEELKNHMKPKTNYY